MKTLTSLLIGAVFFFIPHVSGELTRYTHEDGTPKSFTVLDYSSVQLPTVVPSAPMSYTSYSSVHLPTIVPPPPSLTSQHSHPTGGKTTLPLQSTTVSVTGVSSVTGPGTSKFLSTGKSTSGSLSSTVLSLSLTYIRTSLTSFTASIVSSVVLPTGSSTSDHLGTTTTGFSSSSTAVSTSSKPFQWPSTHSFSIPGWTTLITTTTSLYTNPYLGTSGTGITLLSSTNATLSYAWPTSFLKPSHTTQADFKTQEDDVNTIQWQLPTPPPELEARHIDGDTQEYEICTTNDIFRGTPKPSKTPF